MPNRKPIAAALAALSLAWTASAFAQSTHRNEIHVESLSWGTSAAPAGELAAPLRNAPDGERYLSWKLENQIITSYQTGGSAKPPTEGGPRMLSAGEGGATTAFNGFSNFGDIKGESTDARGVGRVAPLQQLPSPVAPQRSPIAAGPSNALVVGGKLPHSAPALAAPSARR
jgi:hypothetical protein